MIRSRIRQTTTDLPGFQNDMTEPALLWTVLLVLVGALRFSGTNSFDGPVPTTGVWSPKRAAYMSGRGGSAQGRSSRQFQGCHDRI